MPDKNTESQSKQMVLYISSTEQAADFKRRAEAVTDLVKIGTLASFGNESVEDSFGKIAAAMNGGVTWTVFHLPTVAAFVGNKAFIEEIKNLIREGCTKKTKTVIVEVEGAFDKNVVDTFKKLDVQVVADENQLPGIFGKIKSNKEFNEEKYREEYGAFANLADPEFKTINTTNAVDAADSASVSQSNAASPDLSEDDGIALKPYSIDPFEDFLGTYAEDETNDPFNEYANEMQKAQGASNDPFANFGDAPAAPTAQVASDDPFATEVAPAGAPVAQDDPFAAFSDAADPMAVSADSDDPFASPDPSGQLAVQAAVDDPFADASTMVDDNYGFEDVASDPFGTFDDVGQTAEGVLPDELLTGGDEEGYDPFAAYSEDEFTRNMGLYDSGTAYSISEEYDHYDGGDDEEYVDDYGYGYAENEIADVDRLPDGTVSVEYLLNHYGGQMNMSELSKLASMCEPVWDYTYENVDGVGRGKGIFGGIGKKGGISYVDEDMLADSVYMQRREEQDGYYSPPTEPKVIAVQSFKGGVGKTTLSVMLATQLNWVFNPKLLQRLSTQINARVLVFSVNEYDDIPSHDIGYDAPTSEESENDGKNIAELVRVIKDNGGDPTFDQIANCFVSTERNRVFYLPTPTTRERLTENIDLLPEDYKQVLDVCRKFFQFIIIDCPDNFYQDRNDTMSFVFSVSDIIVMIVEADSRSTLNLYHFFDGLKSDANKMPLNPDKCILAVNKYWEPGNPYLPGGIEGQVSYETVCKSLSKHFTRFLCIPFTQPKAQGNILNGNDAKIKYAAAELADTVLEVIDENDEKEARKHGR